SERKKRDKQNAMIDYFMARYRDAKKRGRTGDYFITCADSIPLIISRGMFGSTPIHHFYDHPSTN
ncbi:MAG: hypothetical protein WC477_07635, partial [Patescibacteria group bacterium]